jgi:hypothetical protein
MSPSTARAFYTLDNELRLKSASASTLSLWGKALKDIQERKLTEVFPYVDGGPVHAALEEALHSLQPKRLRVFSIAMGREVDVEIYPVHDGLQVSFG